ncbi:hypothetical protein L3Q82_013020 [Scortum barcoo]|uniref:Uncharacterized protein n=1 Tax=Scortum barcoo TaxID=214431 RepID=A0ACB8W1W1_9TELE|nr:hypothetical protein L3Q82_013020 [Scortum barcoo]
MEKKIGPELTLSFLLMAALCCEASIIELFLYSFSKTTTWTDARLYCQKNYIDLVTGIEFSMGWVSEVLLQNDIPQVWIGLHRDPNNVSAWRWIDLKPGDSLATANDISESSYWAKGQQSGQCAFVSTEDLMWHSERCSAGKEFYCTEGGQIIHYKIKLSWYAASLYCSSGMGYLATISKTDKIEKSGWIGLYQEFGETWRWIRPESSNFTNWAGGEPVTADCASLNTSTGLWESHACSENLNFACFTDNLILVKENKTWEDALSHCRNMGSPCQSKLEPCVYSYDLVSLEKSEDYSYIRKRIYKATTDEVWTGLRFLGDSWWWVNGKRLDNQGQLPDCLSQGKHCGTLSKLNEDEWITKDCSEKRNFICYRAR